MYRYNTPTKRKYIKLTRSGLTIGALVLIVITLAVKELLDLKAI